MNDYDLRREVEHAQALERSKTLQAIAIEVAKELGKQYDQAAFDKWVADAENRRLRMVPVHHYIIGPDDFMLTLSYNQNDKDKIHVSGRYPYGPDNQYGTEFLPYEVRKHVDDSINVSASKTPKQIAADISRRLLPDYESNLVLVREGIAHFIQVREERGSDLKRLASAVGVTVTEELWKKARFSFYKGQSIQGDVEVYRNDADLNLRSVPISKAERILKILAE